MPDPQPSPSSPDRASGSVTPLRFSGYVWVFLAALALRGGYLWEAVRHNELLTFPVVDAQVYVDWARDILAGKWLWYDPMNYTPAIPAWFAGWIALAGWHPVVHFIAFHLIGASQAVLLGKTAELLWDRRAGLVTGWLAALYWPLIVFEATYYAESFAIWNLALGLYLLLRWSFRGGGPGWLLWSGFHLGWSVLARANALVCLPLLALWVFWIAFRRAGASRWWRSFGAATALAVPVISLCGPVAYWNYRLMGKPALRTGGWLSVYLGNNPDYRGLVVPVGVRWTDFVYKPVRAGITTKGPLEEYWRGEVMGVIRDRREEWLQLWGRKTVMLAGQFEISQEIDLGIFRSASRLLALPLWPAWGLVAPLALLTLLAMVWIPEARRGLPLALCALAYFGSIIPVQVAARYRLPVVAPLLPLAGWAGSFLLQAALQRDRRRLGWAALEISLAGLLIWPDWLHLAEEKIINHSFLIGTKRSAEGDNAGARAAFAQGLAWNPADPDCPLWMARIDLERGDVPGAEALFHRSLENFPAAREAMLGLGECALTQGRPDDALARVAQVFQTAPNNLEALDLASRAHAAKADWPAMALACRDMRSYLTHPASAGFSEAWAWVRASRSDLALQVYDTIALTGRFSIADRSRALFLASALAWDRDQTVAESRRRWALMAGAPGGLFQSLGLMLIGAKSEEALLAELPADLGARSAHYVTYARALKAMAEGRRDDARARLEEILKARNARHLPPQQWDVLEVLALQSLEKLR